MTPEQFFKDLSIFNFQGQKMMNEFEKEWQKEYVKLLKKDIKKEYKKFIDGFYADYEPEKYYRGYNLYNTLRFKERKNELVVVMTPDMIPSNTYDDSGSDVAGMRIEEYVFNTALKLGVHGNTAKVSHTMSPAPMSLLEQFIKGYNNSKKGKEIIKQARDIALRKVLQKFKNVDSEILKAAIDSFGV